MTLYKNAFIRSINTLKSISPCCFAFEMQRILGNIQIFTCDRHCEENIESTTTRFSAHARRPELSYATCDWLRRPRHHSSTNQMLAYVRCSWCCFVFKMADSDEKLKKNLWNVVNFPVFPGFLLISQPIPGLRDLLSNSRVFPGFPTGVGTLNEHWMLNINGNANAQLFYWS